MTDPQMRQIVATLKPYFVAETADKTDEFIGASTFLAALLTSSWEFINDETDPNCRKPAISLPQELVEMRTRLQALKAKEVK